MPPGKICAWIKRAVEIFAYAFSRDSMINAKSVKRASTGSRPFNIWLWLFGKGDNQGSAASDAELRLREEGTSTMSEQAHAQTQTPDWATIHPQDVQSALNRQSQEEDSTSFSQRTLDGTSTDFPGREPDTFDDEDRGTSCASSLCETQSRLEGLEQDGDDTATEKPQYPEENRLVVVEDFISLFLTEEAIDRLGRIIVAVRAYKQAQAEFEEAKGEASIGQSYLEYAESQIQDPRIPEPIRNQIKESLEKRKPSILKDIQRKKDLKKELNIQKCSLDYLREQSDGVFEQILSEAGLLEEPEKGKSMGTKSLEEVESDQNARANHKLPSAVSMKFGNGGAEGLDEADNSFQEPPVSAPASEVNDLPAENQDGVASSETFAKSEIRKAKEEHDQAWQALRTAGRLFEEREAAYKKDIAQQADGPHFSKADIDLFHVNLGRQLTQNLRDAEEEFERTRARAKALGILADSVTSDAETVYDDDGDGYLESEDPANNANMTEHAREAINTWAAEVDITEDSISESPAIEWEAVSVNISDSVSVCDENPRQRRRIDQWHKQQESLRQMDFETVG